MDMARPIPDGVLTTREAREHISDFLREAREGGIETPVRFYGAQRKPEAAIMSADLANELLDLMDDVVIAEQIRRRTESDEVESGTVDDFLAGAGVDAARIRRLRASRRGT
jgi:hypothetical protein